MTIVSDIIIIISFTVSPLAAGDLVHMSGPSAFLQSSSWHSGLLVTIRQHLKKNTFTKFIELLDALKQKVCINGIA